MGNPSIENIRFCCSPLFVQIVLLSKYQKAKVEEVPIFSTEGGHVCVWVAQCVNHPDCIHVKAI